MTDRTRLTGDAPAVDVHFDIEAIDHLYRLERLAHDHPRSLATEELLDRSIVDANAALARPQVNAGSRGLAAAGAVIGVRGHRWVLGLQFERLRLLRGVRVLVALEHVQLAVHLPAERILGQHALHGELDRALGVLGHQLLERLALDAADRARVPVVDLVAQLVARYADLLCVQHDDVIAGVHVRRVLGLVLAAQAHSDLRGQAPERLAPRIHHVPVAPHALGTRKNCAHTKAPRPGPAPPAGVPQAERREDGAAGAAVQRAANFTSGDRALQSTCDPQNGGRGPPPCRLI